MVLRIKWDDLARSIEAQVGFIPPECWGDDGSLSQKVESMLRELARRYKARNSFMALTVQYARRKHCKGNVGNRLRLHIHSDTHFKSKIADYDGLDNLYAREDSHLFSLMIARNWSTRLGFRLVLTQEQSPDDKNYICLPNALVSALRTVPPNTQPEECKEHYDKVAGGVTKHLAEVRQSLTELCPGYLSYLGECDPVHHDPLLFKQLFGSFNLAVRILDNPSRLIKGLSHIDIVFCPIGILFKGTRNVIGVMVGVLKPSCSPTTIDSFETILTQVIHCLYFNELLYQQDNELLRRKESLKKQIREKTDAKERQLKYRIVELRAKHKAPDFEKAEMRSLTEMQRTIRTEAGRLTRQTDAATNDSELDGVQTEADTC